jgi:hypothetical protein
MDHLPIYSNAYYPQCLSFEQLEVLQDYICEAVQHFFISDYVKRAFINFRSCVTPTGEIERNVLEVEKHQAFVRKVS